MNNIMRKKHDRSLESPLKEKYGGRNNELSRERKFLSVWQSGRP
jgi:hypothetical protein